MGRAKGHQVNEASRRAMVVVVVVVVVVSE